MMTVAPRPEPLGTASRAHLAPPAPGLSVSEAERMLQSYRGGIYSFIRRKGFSAEEADDLTQETLIRAYQHLSGFRGLSMGAWLYRIAANVAVDYLRKQRLATVPLEGLPLADGDDEDPTAKLARDERCGRVQSVIRELPECHQRILRLRYYEDRSLEEIAGAMNCTPMAAKLRVFRAVTALRKRWRSLAVDGELLAG
jgi:RNA polymerase sigma-70 factor (ECF subfamily)